MKSPYGATHFSDFYGRNQFFKRIEYQHLNQVTDELETLVRWVWWDADEWRGVGFSDRNLKKIYQLEK